MTDHLATTIQPSQHNRKVQVSTEESVPADPSDNMNSAEDFLLLLLHSHTISAAKAIQSLNPLTSVVELATAIIIKFVHLPTFDSSERPAVHKAGVYMYAVELFTLALLWHGFYGAIKEGDTKSFLRY